MNPTGSLPVWDLAEALSTQNKAKVLSSGVACSPLQVPGLFPALWLVGSLHQGALCLQLLSCLPHLPQGNF